MPLPGPVESNGDDDDGLERAHRAGWRDVTILWVVLLVVVVLIAVL